MRGASRHLNTTVTASHPIVCFTVPVLGPHMLHLCPYIIKVPIALLTVMVLRAICIVLGEALLAAKIDLAVVAYPVATRVLRVLFVGSLVREPPLAAITVDHRVVCCPTGDAEVVGGGKDGPRAAAGTPYKLPQ
jgi:hypothetical protein